MLKVIVLTLAMIALANAAGQWQSGSISEVQDLSRWATKQMSGMAGLEGEYTIQTPKNVQKQIVAGVNYKFTLDVVHRDANGKYTFKSCEMFIFEQKWTNTRQFVESPTCKDNQVTRNGLGGWQAVTGINDEILNVARLSAKQLNVQLGFVGEHNVAKVYNVQKQVVSGINYKFTVEYLVATEDNKYFSRICDMAVNHQPWNNNKITFLSEPVCRANPQFPYNGIVGGWTAQTAVTSDILDLAKWSAGQMSAYTGINGEHTVMTARNIMTQVVNGINYKFTLDLLVNDSETNKYTFKSCDVNIYVQASTNIRKFNEEPKCGPHPNFD